ncbi:hypothetical protein [Algirhabdus cladophorae]|uniref:hypothetical protein n=1 Tax=Algirhabdus cladophorae TaxID=3377108 RepID=UPI003B8477B6
MSDASPAPSRLSPERLSAWTKFLLLAALPTYLILDFGASYFSGEARREYRESICFKFEDEADEALRQRQLPVSVLGKVDHFLRCGAIKEFSLLGGKISNDRIIAKKKDNTEATSEALAAIASVENRLQSLQGGTRPSAVQSAEVVELSSSLDQVRETLVQNVQQQEAQILSLEKVTKAAPVAGNWLIVAGSNKTLETGLQQVKLIRGILQKTITSQPELADQLAIYQRGGNYRTALALGERDMAEKVLDAILPQLKYGGYLRVESDWCPEISQKRRVASVTLITCAAK